MKRMSWVVASVAATLIVAGASWATASRMAIEGANRSISAANPEPTAALLFGLGTGVVAWRLSRKRRA